MDEDRAGHGERRLSSAFNCFHVMLCIRSCSKSASRRSSSARCGALRGTSDSSRLFHRSPMSRSRSPGLSRAISSRVKVGMARSPVIGRRRDIEAPPAAHSCTSGSPAPAEAGRSKIGCAGRSTRRRPSSSRRRMASEPPPRMPVFPGCLSSHPDPWTSSPSPKPVSIARPATSTSIPGARWRGR